MFFLQFAQKQLTEWKKSSYIRIYKTFYIVFRYSRSALFSPYPLVLWISLPRISLTPIRIESCSAPFQTPAHTSAIRICRIPPVSRRFCRFSIRRTIGKPFFRASPKQCRRKYLTKKERGAIRPSHHCLTLSRISESFCKIKNVIIICIHGLNS